MNSDLFRHSVGFLAATSLFLVGCKNQKSTEPPDLTPSQEQVEIEEAEYEEGEPIAEDISEPEPLVREAPLYSPRPFPDLRVIYGQ
jgi:hypothetical protein